MLICRQEQKVTLLSPSEDNYNAQIVLLMLPRVSCNLRKLAEIGKQVRDATGTFATSSTSWRHTRRCVVTEAQSERLEAALAAGNPAARAGNFCRYGKPGEDASNQIVRRLLERVGFSKAMCRNAGSTSDLQGSSTADSIVPLAPGDLRQATAKIGPRGPTN
ncbi:hypothetical protein ACCO45_006343 [Purpureocillium lilacinum]|uniref:Uncharacterized protein n=1 Tax=Purpureocillium lilacinum TaxID=33203 RepID=A0ACC4DRV9_PURLI